MAELHSLGLKAQRYGCCSEQCFCRDSCIEEMRKQNTAPANDAKTSGGWYVAKLNSLGVPALSGVETTLLPGREGAGKSCHALTEQIPLEKRQDSVTFCCNTNDPLQPSSPASATWLSPLLPVFREPYVPLESDPQATTASPPSPCCSLRVPWQEVVPTKVPPAGHRGASSTSSPQLR